MPTRKIAFTIDEYVLGRLERHDMFSTLSARPYLALAIAEPVL